MEVKITFPWCVEMRFLSLQEMVKVDPALKMTMDITQNFKADVT